MKIHFYQNYRKIPEIEKVIALIKEQMFAINSEKSDSAIDEALKNALMEGKRALLVLNYSDDDPIGFIFGNIGSGIESGGDYFWINEIHVKKDFRHQGIGSSMVEALENWLKDRKIMYIAAVTNNQNNLSKGLFHKLNYDIKDLTWIDKNLL